MSLFKSLTSINNSLSSKNKNLNNIYKNEYLSSKYNLNTVQVFYEDDATDAGDDFGNPKN